MDNMNGGAVAAPAAPMQSAPGAPQDLVSDGGQFTVCIRCTTDKQYYVYVENAANEAAEGQGEDGAGLPEGGAEDEPGGQTCKSVKEALTLALEIIRNDGRMPKAADDEFQKGFGSPSNEGAGL